MTESSKLVTVAIPTRNRISGLVKALRSVSGQTYKDLEIIISDNNSSGDVAGALAAVKDSRIKYFRHDKDLSMTENWNFCLGQAAGKYFLLLSDDDTLALGAIETLAQAFLREKTALAYGRAIYRSEEGEFMGMSREAPHWENGVEFIEASLSGRRQCLPSCTLFRTEAARLLGGYPETGNSADLALNLSLASAGTVFFNAAPIMEYAIHPGGLSVNPAKTREGFLKLSAWAADRSSPVAKWKNKISAYCASSLRAWARSSALQGDRAACRSFIESAVQISGAKPGDKFIFPLLLCAPVRYLFNARRAVNRLFRRAKGVKAI